VPSRFDELAAALGGALDHRLDPVLGDELPERDPADVGRGDDRDHLVAVAAEHHRGHVLDRHPRLPGDEGREACRVEDPGHARRRAPSASRRRSSATWHMASSGFETTTTIASGLAAATCSVTDSTIFSFVVHQVVAAHAGLRGRPGRDHDDLRACRLRRSRSSP
jgi:hypothetical protein